VSGVFATAIAAPASPPTRDRQGGWTPQEEDRLYRIVKSENPNGGTTTEFWAKLADRLAGETGLPRRSASSVRHRATKLAAYSKRPEEKPAVAVAPVVAQGSFGSVEARLLVADALERVAKELRG